MKLKRTLLTLVATLTLGASLFLVGCGNNPKTSDKQGQDATQKCGIKETGVLTLSVNPKIRIEYDKEGQVTALTGVNDDGLAIVSSYQNFAGKNCETVMKELIVKIHDAGYFVDDVDGNQKNIVIQLEPGSVLPTDTFLEDVSRNTEATVQELNLTSGIVTIDDDDYDPAYAKNGEPSPYITLEKAQELALTQANINAADATFANKKFDLEDGTPIFELEFTANGNKYEYDVDAVTGKILKASHTAVGADDDTDNDTDDLIDDADDNADDVADDDTDNDTDDLIDDADDNADDVADNDTDNDTDDLTDDADDNTDDDTNDDNNTDTDDNDNDGDDN